MFPGSPESCLSILAEAHLVRIRFTDTRPAGYMGLSIAQRRRHLRGSLEEKDKMEGPLSSPHRCPSTPPMH